MANPTLLHNLKGHKKSITGISFHPDNNQFVTSSNDNSVMMWNILPKNTRCYNLTGHTDAVTCVDFAPNGQLFASSSQDRTVRLWIPSVRGGCTEFKPHTSAVRTVSFSPTNDKLLTGSNDKTIKIWDVQTKRFILSLSGHNNWVRCAKYNPDGNVVASCSDDRTVRIWDLTCGQCIHVFTSSKGSGNYLSVHTNGHTIALAMNNGSVRIYDTRTKKLQQHYVLHDKATCVVWHPNANFLLTSGADGTMKVVDIMEGRPLFTLEAHEGTIQSIAFSKNGEYFASGGDDKFVKVWKTNFITSSPSTSSLSSCSEVTSY